MAGFLLDEVIISSVYAEGLVGILILIVIHSEFLVVLVLVMVGGGAVTAHLVNRWRCPYPAKVRFVVLGPILPGLDGRCVGAFDLSIATSAHAVQVEAHLEQPGKQK